MNNQQRIKKEHKHFHEFYTMLEMISGIMCPVGLFIAVMSVLARSGHRSGIVLCGLIVFVLALFLYSLAAKGIILLETSNDTMKTTNELTEIRKLLEKINK